MLIGLTRSVAEPYNFDEDKSRSELFSFNALHDTDKEWYSQPVGEVIYQEYSNSEATAWGYLRTNSDARLIDACSTQDNEQTQEENEDRGIEQWLGSGLDQGSSEHCGVHYTWDFLYQF